MEQAARREPCTESLDQRIGGLQIFADQLWDDYAIGQAIRAAGLRVNITTATRATMMAYSAVV